MESPRGPTGPPCACGHLCSRAHGVGSCPCRARGDRCQYRCQCGTSLKSCRNSGSGSNNSTPTSSSTPKPVRSAGKAHSQPRRTSEEGSFYSHSFPFNGSSKSVHLRQTGKEHYRAAFEPNIELEDSRGELEKALRCFQQALIEADTPDEMSSAAQNIGFSAWKLALVQKHLEEPLTTISNSFQLSLANFQKAINFGGPRGADWVSGIKDSESRCLESAIDIASETLKGAQRARFLEELLTKFEGNKLKAMCFLAIAKALFYAALEALECEDSYKTALSLLHDCHYPLEEAARLHHGDFYHDSNVSELRKDIVTNLSIAESIQARKIGDGILKKALENEEDLSLDQVWAAVDWYKEAILLTREKQLEYEAAALSRLGSVYYKVLKLKKRAKENFMKCMQLALALAPKSPENEAWFKECREALDTMQREYLQSEEVQKQMEREKYMGELKEEMKDMWRIRDRWCGSRYDEEMLSHIYKTYPPVNKNHRPYSTKKDWDQKTRKKALQKAILHYHPDKVNAEEHGMKMKYLCEEITKVLTNVYTRGSKLG